MKVVRKKRKPLAVYTMGHSTRSMEGFLSCLESRGIKKVIDVRSSPTSRYVPHFNWWEMKKWLRRNDVAYVHIPEVGGHRPKPSWVNPEIIGAWTNRSFSNYAGHMQTEEYQSGIRELISEASEVPSVYFCSELQWFRCHRRMISDTLLVEGIEIHHIWNETEEELHELTKFALVEGHNIYYPVCQLKLII